MTHQQTKTRYILTCHWLEYDLSPMTLKLGKTTTSPLSIKLFLRLKANANLMNGEQNWNWCFFFVLLALAVLCLQGPAKGQALQFSLLAASVMAQPRQSSNTANAHTHK